MTRPLDPDRWARIEGIFAGALERSGAARRAWLDEHCGDDAELRAEVESLLGAHAHGNAIPVLDRPAAEFRPDWRIGPYRLIEPIGSGGMGTVFLAEREGPDYVQRVALKLIRAGRGDEMLEERLRSERRILARLEHPHIARLIDGDVTPEGQPFYAMEYVAGESLMKWCDARQLTVRERLRLFLRVCEAVQHAHSQLVVHRDLKPSNILVTKDGHPKLLDFGIAKLVDPEVEGGTTTGPWVTPAYASPEQVRGEAAGTPSDIYSLGVLLYELLSGRRPYDLEGRPPADAQRLICDVVPAPPSERVSNGQADAIAEARSLSVDRLRRDLQGDLDTIVLKALAKDPSRRYASAAQLAEDLRRHLDGRPVLARPDSLAYRTSRFVRRHRVPVVAAIMVLFALVGGSALALWQARRATFEATLAREEAAKARAVTDFMSEIFRMSDPNLALGDTITAREMLDAGAVRIDAEFAEQPDLQATLLLDVAAVYSAIGRLDRADEIARRVLSLRTSLYGPESAEVAEGLGLLGTVQAQRGERDDAIATLQRALSLREGSVPEPDSIASRLRAELGWQLRDAGEYDAAREQFSRSLEQSRAIFGRGAQHNGSALMGMAASLHDDGQFEEAEQLFKEALPTTDSLVGRPNPMAATALFNLGQLLRLRERVQEAEGFLRSAHAMRSALYEDTHLEVLDAARAWGRSLTAVGRPGEAERLLSDALDRTVRTLGRDHPMAGSLRGALGEAEMMLGAYDVATAQFDTAHALEQTIHAQHPETVLAVARLAQGLAAAGRTDAARARFRETITLSETVSGPESVYRILGLHGLANLARDSGRPTEADTLYAAAEALAARQLRPGHRYTRRLQRDHALLAIQEGDPNGALPTLERISELEREVFPRPHPEHGETLLALARAHLALGDTATARAALLEALDEFVRLPADHPHVRAARTLLARAQQSAVAVR